MTTCICSLENTQGYGSAPIPQEPTENDTQTMAEYKEKLDEFNIRSHYIEGLHTNGTYSTMAHYWLIKDLLKAQNWRFVTDNDISLHSAMYRSFV